MTVGSKVRLGTNADGERIYGRVIYIHPQKRFCVVERDAPYGAKLRQTVYLGVRRAKERYKT